MEIKKEKRSDVPFKTISDMLPVGSVVNGVVKAKNFTDYEYVDEQKQLEQDTKLKEDLPKCILNDEEEEIIKEKLADKTRINQISKKIEDLMGDYEPGKNIDKKAECPRLADELKIVRYLVKQYRENVKKLFSEMEDEDISNALSSEKKVEIDEIIEEMVRSTHHRGKKEYTVPECKVVKVEENESKNKINSEHEHNDFDGICRDLMALHERKNKDYGNAADASYREFGIVSYVIRLNDKMNRLKSLTKPGVIQEVKDESVEDTLMDLAAYAIMTLESIRNKD